MMENKKEATTEVVEEVVEPFRLLTVISDQDVVKLRETSEPVAFVVADNSGDSYLDKDTQELIAAPKSKLVSMDALGLAAIQVGIAKRVFVMKKPWSSNRVLVVINPKIHNGRGKGDKVENCLSIPNLPPSVKGVMVRRRTTITVSYTNESGVLQEEEMFVGMDARVFQHEFDHLDGYLILDDKTTTGKFMGWARDV